MFQTDSLPRWAPKNLQNPIFTFSMVKKCPFNPNFFYFFFPTYLRIQMNNCAQFAALWMIFQT